LQKSKRFLYYARHLSTNILIYTFMDFTKAQEMMKLQQKAQKIQDELSNVHIEAEVDGVVVTVDGQMKVVSFVIENPSILSNQKALEKAACEAINKGLKKSQEIAAEKMRDVMGEMGLNIPGM
jgi:DNA-binding protein YbaB